MFKIYIPNHSEKPLGRNCVHTEFKIQKAVNIRSVGFYTLPDLLSTSLSSWYQQRVMYRAINKKEIGKQIRKKMNKKPAGDRQCEKEFNKYFNEKIWLAHLVYHEDKKHEKHLIQCDSP